MYQRICNWGWNRLSRLGLDGGLFFYGLEVIGKQIIVCATVELIVNDEMTSLWFELYLEKRVLYLEYDLLEVKHYKISIKA